MTTRPGLAAYICELIHLVVWGAKKRVVSHAVVSCHVVSSMCELVVLYLEK